MKWLGPLLLFLLTTPLWADLIPMEAQTRGQHVDIIVKNVGDEPIEGLLPGITGTSPVTVAIRSASLRTAAHYYLSSLSVPLPGAAQSVISLTLAPDTVAICAPLLVKVAANRTVESHWVEIPVNGAPKCRQDEVHPKRMRSR